MTRIAILGTGSLGGAVAAGLLAADVVRREDLACVTATEAGAARVAAALGVTAGTDARAAVTDADVVLIGVKPPSVVPLLRAVGPDLARDAVVVSLAAGVALADLAAALPPGTAVVRVLTNTPVRVRAAASLLVAPAGIDPAALARVTRLTDALGTTHPLAESQLDVATALAGCGPAYVFLVAEALVDAAVALGLDPGTAMALTVGTLAGAARLLADPVTRGGGPAAAADPAALRREVTSPGGMTAAALAVLEDAGLRAAFRAALAAAADRATTLAAGPPAAPSA